MRTRYEPFAALLGASLLILALAGCARATRPVAARPDDPATAAAAAVIAPGAGVTETSTGFYPLDLGNWWHYQARVQVTTYTPGGDPITFGEESDRTHELVCVQPYLGRDYVVERQTWFDEPLYGARQYVLFRQHGYGLYEADRDVLAIPACDEPIRGAASPAAAAARPFEAITRQLAADSDPVRARAALAAWTRFRERMSVLAGASRIGPRGGGALEGEITRLRYPLRAGARWQIREDPGLLAVVDGAKSLELPIGKVAAWQIRIVWETAPSLVARTWYGHSGYMGLYARDESELTDDAGNVIGRAVFEQREICDGIRLVTPGRFGSVPVTPASPWPVAWRPSRP